MVWGCHSYLYNTNVCWSVIANNSIGCFLNIGLYIYIYIYTYIYSVLPQKQDAIFPEDPLQTILKRVGWQCTLNIYYEIYAFCFQFALCIYLRYPYILYPFQHPFHHFAIPSSCIPKDIWGKWAECETGSLFHCIVLARAFTSYPFHDFGMYLY